MRPKTALVTGSSGLIGSEAVAFLAGRGWRVHGIDNNMRRDFFGPDGDTIWNLERLRREVSGFDHHDLDIRDRPAIAQLVHELQPQLVFHCAAQPSHDLAAFR
jgi:CDP-paratose 2-epimerase